MSVKPLNSYFYRRDNTGTCLYTIYITRTCNFQNEQNYAADQKRSATNRLKSMACPSDIRIIGLEGAYPAAFSGSLLY
jgi:hypothetical protein